MRVEVEPSSVVATGEMLELVKMVDEAGADRLGISDVAMLRDTFLVQVPCTQVTRRVQIGSLVNLRRTVSYDRLSTTPNSTNRSASPPQADNVHWSWPSGAGEKPRAISCASLLSSSLRYRLTWGRSRNTPSKPSAAYRRLTPYTVPSDTSRASAICGAFQSSSIFSSMRAQVTTCAESARANQPVQSFSFLRDQLYGVSLPGQSDRTSPQPQIAASTGTYPTNLQEIRLLI